MNLETILLCQIPEAIYFALFIILCRNIESKKKSFLFIIISIIQYLLIAKIFIFNSWFQLIYLMSLRLNCYMFFKKKSNVLDLVYILIASIILIVLGIPMYFIFSDNMMLGNVFVKLVAFLMMYLVYKKSDKINNFYYKHWNKSDANISFVTFRTINVMVINILFIIVNICMVVIPFLK